ncbi:MAG TPA: response regulator [Pirellulales bacterium]|jgi:response regulator RpfG family c-di-GMP phosphodiesterase|nr:response regulator [Pirellulales bacterium]
MCHVAVDQPRTTTDNSQESQSAELQRILVIDDDPDLCRILKTQLQNYMVEVFTSSFGLQGYWDAMLHLPDVIITDLRMPQGSGDYVVECLKRHPHTCRIPIIVLTGCRNGALQSYLHGLGIVEYLVKPVPFEELCHRLGRYVSLVPREIYSSEPEDQLQAQRPIMKTQPGLFNYHGLA